MNEIIYLDMVTKDSVSIRKQNFAAIDGVEYPIGKPWRRAYSNSISGRLALQTEVVEPYYTSIMSMWGDTPTVEEISVD